MRALIIDDEPAIRQMLSAVLKRAGWEVNALASGEEAVEHLAWEQYDALLIDKNLPGIDGVEVVRQVRAKDGRVVCVMITGYANSESARETLNLDIDAYVQKPLDNVMALTERLAELIAARTGRSTPARRDTTPGEIAVQASLNALIVSNNDALGGQVAELLVGVGLPLVETLAPSQTAVQTIATRAPQVVVFDATTDSATTQMIRALNARPPTPEYAVVTGPETPVTDVVTYIDLGVRALVETPVTKKQFEAAFANLMGHLNR